VSWGDDLEAGGEKNQKERSAQMPPEANAVRQPREELPQKNKDRLGFLVTVQ